MARPLRTLLLGLAFLAVPACGRKGPLELPPGREPMPVENLTANPGRASVLLTWTNPVKAVSGKPVGPLEAVEVWVFDHGLPSGGRALTSEEVERTARRVRRISRREFDSSEFASGGSPGVLACTVPVVPRPSGPATLAFTVRVFDAKGRASDFAAPVAVDVARKNAGVDRPAAEGVS